MQILALKTSQGASEFKESILIVSKLPRRLHKPQLQQVGPASKQPVTFSSRLARRRFQMFVFVHLHLFFSPFDVKRKHLRIKMRINENKRDGDGGEEPLRSM